MNDGEFRSNDGIEIEDMDEMELFEASSPEQGGLADGTETPIDEDASEAVEEDLAEESQAEAGEVSEIEDTSESIPESVEQEPADELEDEPIREERGDDTASVEAASEEADSLEALAEEPEASADSDADENSLQAEDSQQAEDQPETDTAEGSDVADADEEAQSDEAPEEVSERQRQEWQRLLTILERELGVTTDPLRMAELHFAVGEILELQFGETERAVLNYQQAYAANPSHQPTLKAATRLFKEFGRWEMVIELLEAQENSTLTQSEKLDLLIEKAQVYATRLEQPEVAATHLERVLDIDPRNETAFKLLEKIYSIGGEKNLLIEFYKRYIYDPNFAELHVSLMQNLAQIQSEEDHQQIDAVETYHKIIELDTHNLLAISALKRLLVKQENWDELAKLYEQEEVVTEEPQRQALLKYLRARLLSDRLGRTEQAIELLQQALEIDPTNILLLDELEAIYEAAHEWQQLVGVHERQFELADEEGKRVDIAFKLGALLQERLQQYSEAAIWYEKALEAKSDYLPALHVLGKIYSRAGEFEKLLEIYRRELALVEDARLKADKYFTIAEHAQQNLSDFDLAIDSYRHVLELLPGYLPAIKALSELFSYLGRLRDLIEMNELQVEHNPNLSGEQFVYLLEKNASLWELEGELDHAVDCHRRILQRRPEYLPSIQALGRICHKAGMWEDLLEINRQEVDLINDQHRIVSLLYKSGEVCEYQLEDTERAVGYYRRVLTLSPSYLPAVKALGAVYHKQQRWEDLIKMYHRELETVKEGEQAVSIRFKVAQIYDERLDDYRKAEMNYRKILQENPDFTPALHALTKLFQREGNSAALIEILEGQIKASQDPAGKLLSLYKIAELYESRLHDMENAESAYLRILELDPDNLAASRGLFRIYAQINDKPKQLSLTLKDLEREQDVAKRLPLLVTAADICNELDDKGDEAVRLYREILDLEPGNEVAFQQLERLFRHSRSFGELCDLYEARLLRTEEDKKRLSLLWMTIDLLENHLDDFERLLACYTEVLRIDSYNARALEFFEDVYIHERQWEDLLEIYERMRQLTEDREQLLHINVASGQLLELELGRNEQAARRYESALALAPHQFAAVQGAKRVYAKLERWSDLMGLLEDELEVASSSIAYIAIAYQLAYIKETKFGQRPQAAKLYGKILELDPGHKDAFVRARKLLTEAQDYQKLIEIGERRLSTISKNQEEQEELHSWIAKLAEEGLSDIERAIAHRKRLVEYNPQDNSQMKLLADLYVKSSEWNEAIELYETIAPRIDNADELRELYYTMGRIYQEELQNNSRAVSAFETIFSYEPDDMQAMERLGELYMMMGLAEESSEMLQKLLSHDLPREKEIRYNLMVGEINLSQLNDEDEAIAYFERAMALDPSNRKVIDTLSSIFEKRGKWDQLVSIYERNIEEAAEGQTGKRVELLMGLAQLEMEKIGDVEKALERLKAARELDEYNLEIQAMQAEAMGMNALYYLEAIDTHRHLLAQNPFRVESYQEMFRIFTERKELDKAFCCLIALDFLKALDEEQAALYRQQRESVTGGIAATIPEKAQKQLLVHPREKGSLRDIFHHLETALYKLEPVNLEPYDLPNCKVAGVNSSIYHLMENAAYHLGVDLFKVYISQKQPDILAVENTKPPTVIVGGNLAFATEGVKRFLSGIIMSRISNDHVQFADLDPAQLRYWAEVVAHMYIPEVMVRDADAEQVEDLVKRLNRVISKPARKELELAAQNYYKQEPKPDFKKFRDSMHHTDNRMGLLLAGDMMAAAECLIFLETGEPYRNGGTTTDIVERFRSHEQIKELLVFLVSEDLFELRKLVRMNVE